MIRSLLLAAVTPLFVPASPSPPAAPLPQIGRVRSNALCTTLRQNIAPSIAGLMKNDEIIGAGHRAFAKMSRDAGDNSSGSIEIDKLYLEQVETRLVHNLKVIDKMLGDEQRFPAQPKTADEREAAAMKSQLLAVAQSQRRALDLVSGTLDTEMLGQLQSDNDNAMKAAVGAPGPVSVPTAEPVSFIGAAGLPDYSPQAGLPTRESKLSTLGGHTPYDGAAEALEETQVTTAHREQVVTAAVIAAVGDCRATIAPSPVPQGIPGGSPSP